MKITEEHASVLQMEKIYFKKLKFDRKVEKEINTDDMSFNISIKTNEQEGRFYLELGVNIQDKDKTDFEVDCVLLGIFNVDLDVPPEIKETLLKKNTTAILFPYMRSQVTLLTSQPNMEPIIIPTINVNKLIDSIEK